MTLEERAENVKSLRDLREFIAAYRADYETNKEEWENRDLSAFVEALAGWCADMDGFYALRGKSPEDVSPWSLFSDMLMGARIYE
jgi:hypothetical protein